MTNKEMETVLINFCIFLNERDIMFAHYLTGERKPMGININEFINKEQKDG